MSQENVERWRAQIEVIRAGTSEIDREAMLTNMSQSEALEAAGLKE